MTQQPTRILLVDDNPHIHDVVARLLNATDDLHLIGQAYNGADAVRFCARQTPDVILMDVIMPQMDGVQATRAILQQHPQIKVLVLSSFNEYDYIRAMLDVGALGYLVKNALLADLVDTIRSTVKGNTVLSPEAARLVLDPPQPTSTSSPDFGLTEREQQVLALLAQGQTNAQIAQALSISQRTVRFHFENILGKLGVQTRSEALVLAARSGLI